MRLNFDRLITTSIGDSRRYSDVYSLPVREEQRSEDGVVWREGGRDIRGLFVFPLGTQSGGIPQGDSCPGALFALLGLSARQQVHDELGCGVEGALLGHCLREPRHGDSAGRSNANFRQGEGE